MTRTVVRWFRTGSWIKLNYDHGARPSSSGSDIVISMPGTSYTVTYYRATGSRQLLAKQFPMKGDPRVAMTVSEFLIRAWKLANNKARERGWIV
jgi:hypothetical protein